MVPLELLGAGEWGRVADVSGAAGEVARLAELGLRPGAPVRMVRPGCPCLVEIHGARYGIRGDTADHVLVVPCEAPIGGNSLNDTMLDVLPAARG